MSEFTDRITNILKEKNISKFEFYEKVGLTAQTFYDWKKRCCIPSGEVCVRIAKYLQTTTEFLLTGDDTNPYKKLLEQKEQQIIKLKEILSNATIEALKV